MSKTRDTGFLNNVVKTDSQGNVFFVSGSTTLLSISSSGAVTTTGVISGSNALSASYAQNSELLDNLDSTSFVFTSSYNTDSSSVSTRTTNLESTASVLTTASASFSVVSSSFVEVSSSYSAASGSLSTRVTNIEGNYATTGSNVFLGAQTVCANITSTGTIVAQTLNVQQVTSSVVYSSGSNQFGNLLTDVQQFTGSVTMTGSLGVFTAGTTPEFQVGVGGTTKGNALTDIHQVTGSLRITGSVASFSNCVGIGVTSPCYPLHVVACNVYHISAEQASTDINNVNAYATFFIINNAGASQIKGYLGAGGNSVSNVGMQNHVYAGSQTNHGFRLFTNDTARVTITNTGIACFSCQVCAPYISVGDGVQCNADDAPLTIKRGNAFAGLDFKSLRTEGNIGGSRFYNCAGTLQAQQLVEIDGSFNFYNATSNNRFKITSTGISCFACQVCVPRLQVFNTNSIIVVEGTATSGEGTVTIAGKNSSGTSRSAIFKYDNEDVIRVATADAIRMRFETSDVTRLTIASTGIATFACQVCAPAAIFTGCVGISTNNPAYQLDLTGNDNAPTSTYLRVYSNNRTVWTGIGYQRLETNGDLAIVAGSTQTFRAGGADRITLTSTGIATFTCQICTAGILNTSFRISNARVNGTWQEWVAQGITLTNNSAIALFCINSQYDNLIVDLAAWIDQGAWSPVSYRFNIGYNVGTSYVAGLGAVSAICGLQGGTTYNETWCWKNCSGGNISNSAISLRIFGRATNEQISTGGRDLIVSSYLTRVS